MGQIEMDNHIKDSEHKMKASIDHLHLELGKVRTGRASVALVEGGTFINGRHTRGIGFARDAEKYNLACELGWRVFRYTGEMVRTGAAIDQIERCLCSTLHINR